MLKMATLLLFLYEIIALPLIGATKVEPELKDGVVSYRIEGRHRETVDVGRRCADLWVAPDESVFAFIGIDRSSGLDPNGEPFVLASTVYIARKSEHFVPVRVALKTIKLYGQDWEIFRMPKVLPDGGTVLFSVPTSITSQTIFSHNLQTGLTKEIGDAIVSYCVVWGGAKSGTILMQRRQINDLVLKYPCYAKMLQGNEVRLADMCEDFEEFSLVWSRSNRGGCE